MTLPNFLVIGANKGGTTSLHEYLSQHPQIFMSAIKEPMYFALRKEELNRESSAERKVLRKAITCIDDYEELFESADDSIAIGESSTAYLANPNCAERIKLLIPSVKILALLRHPIDRAFSNYRMYRRWGFENRTFSRAVEDELNGKSQSLPQGQRYLELSLYSQSLEHYFAAFGKDQVRVFLFDDFVSNTPQTLSQICSFLNVDSGFRFATSEKFNVDSNKSILTRIGSLISRKDRLTKRTAIKLNRYFLPEIESLQTLLAVDLTNWKTKY